MNKAKDRQFYITYGLVEDATGQEECAPVFFGERANASIG
jgi:hypothetical protein